MKSTSTKFTSIREAIKKGKGEVAIRGWVYRERGSNQKRFLVLRDSSEIIQCIIDRDSVPAKLWKDAEKLLVESSVEIFGAIREDKRAPTGYEVQVKNLKVVHFAEKYPLTKDASTEVLLDNRHLALRSRRLTAVMKIRSTVTGAIHEFFRKRGYYEFDAPILQPTQCEGGSTLFSVNYYNQKTFLSQTWQLYAEAGIFALEKIYNMGPTFRAEKSKTSRHLSEFWMAEMEAAWMELPELAQVAKDEVKFIIQQVLNQNKEELIILGRDIKKLQSSIQKPFPTITYTQALKILKEKENLNVSWGKDLRTIEEDKLMKHFDTPVVVTNYPKEIMAFYKPSDPRDPKTALCMDMLAPEGYGEIIGGSQRDIDIKEIEKALKKDKEDPRNYKFYLDLRKYGSVLHSGYGLGVERVVSWICGLDNIKDAIPFPRTMLRTTP
ncbi:MAG: asparagine--tRNA ligase [Nanoarchaeota archaeon]|nr:asparagine--tRNA ligase [Nanoarchaeota archaeon]